MDNLGKALENGMKFVLYVLVPLAAIGAVAAIGAFVWLIVFLFHHLRWA